MNLDCNKYAFFIAVEIPSITALNKSGLKIIFTWEKSKEQLDTVNMTMTAHNSLSTPMTDFLFQAAVPRVNNKLKKYHFETQHIQYPHRFSDFSNTNAISIRSSYSVPG